MTFLFYVIYFFLAVKKKVQFICNLVEHKVCAGVTSGMQYRRNGRKKQRTVQHLPSSVLAQHSNTSPCSYALVILHVGE